MEIKYMVTLNDKANYLARIRTSKKGRIALRYQKLIARISKVLASNLNKTMTVKSEYALKHTRTELEYYLEYLDLQKSNLVQVIFSYNLVLKVLMSGVMNQKLYTNSTSSIHSANQHFNYLWVITFT